MHPPFLPILFQKSDHPTPPTPQIQFDQAANSHGQQFESLLLGKNRDLVFIFCKQRTSRR